MSSEPAGPHGEGVAPNDGIAGCAQYDAHPVAPRRSWPRVNVDLSHAQWCTQSSRGGRVGRRRDRSCPCRPDRGQATGDRSAHPPAHPAASGLLAMSALPVRGVGSLESPDVVHQDRQRRVFGQLSVGQCSAAGMGCPRSRQLIRTTACWRLAGPLAGMAPGNDRDCRARILRRPALDLCTMISRSADRAARRQGLSDRLAAHG